MSEYKPSYRIIPHQDPILYKDGPAIVYAIEKVNARSSEIALLNKRIKSNSGWIFILAVAIIILGIKVIYL